MKIILILFSTVVASGCSSPVQTLDVPSTTTDTVTIPTAFEQGSFEKVFKDGCVIHRFRVTSEEALVIFTCTED